MAAPFLRSIWWEYSAVVPAFRKHLGRVLYEDYVKSLNPIGYWRLGETSGSTAVDAMGSFNGSYVDSTDPNVNVGAPSASTTGASLILNNGGDLAQSFDGVDHFVRIPDAAALDGFSAFSVGCWVQTSMGNTASAVPILSKSESGDTETYRLLFPSGLTSQTGTLHFRVATNNGTVNVPGNVNVGTETFIFGTYDGSTAKLFWAKRTDPSLSSSSLAQTGTVNTSNSPLTFGRFDNAAPPSPTFWSGRIDEVMLFNRALKDREVEELFLLGSRVQAADIVPSGSLVRTPNKSLVGTIFPTSSLSKEARKNNIGGSVTPSGQVAKNLMKTALGGVISPTGALIKKAMVNLAGSISMTATLLVTKIFNFIVPATPKIVATARMVFLKAKGKMR